MDVILVAIEHVDGAPRRGSLELLSAARALAGAEPVTAAVVADAGVADAVAPFADRVLLLEGDGLRAPNHERRTAALAAAAREAGATLVLMAAGRSGQAVAPRLAVRLGGSLLEDVAGLRRDGGAWLGERLAYLSRAVLTVRSEATIAIATVKAGTYPAPAAAGGRGEVRRVPIASVVGDDLARPGERRAAGRGRVALEEAEVVVCGGRGVGSAEAFEALVVGLADDLGAAVAATRAAVDAGWRPYAEQVGQTGKSVSPRLYLAVGVSGAVQHVSGMNRSGTVVAINKDPEAPLFQLADYAVVGDVHAVVPALRSALAGMD